MSSKIGIVGVLCFLAFGAVAQKTFDLELERQVRDSILVLDLSIKKKSGADFALGASNFDFKVVSAGLDVSKARFVPGVFDVLSDPESYAALGTASKAFFSMNVRPNSAKQGNGRMVTDQKQFIGSVEIPITNPCATVSPDWVIGNGAIHSFFKTATGEEITSKANYVLPGTIDLDNGISKTIPLVDFVNGKLVSSSSNKNQWYLNGTPIPGATEKQFNPIVEGKYSVEVTYPCAKNMSTIVPVTITGLSDFSISYDYNAQPNPFVGESSIVYTLPNSSNIKLELYDLSGTHIVNLESGLKMQGRNEFVFKPTLYNLTAGTYIAKLTVGDKVGKLKLVALK